MWSMSKRLQRSQLAAAMKGFVAAAVHFTDHHDALINENDSRRPESFCGCGAGQAMNQTPTLLKQLCCVLAVSEAGSDGLQQHATRL